MIQQQIINSKKFSDLQNSSFLPSKASINGNELWFKNIPKQRLGDAPYHLCISNDCLIAVYVSWVDVLNTATGDEIWSREFYNTHDFVLNQDGILVISPNDEFYVISLKNDKTTLATFPIFSDYRTVFHVQKIKDVFVYLYNRYPSSFDTRPKLIEGFTISKYNPTENDLFFSYDNDETIRCFALSEDNNKCFLSTVQHFFSFPLSIEKKKELNKIDLPSINSFSIYTDGNIIGVLDVLNDKRIISFTPKGAINWEYAINEISESGQPPAFAPGGNIYYCAGTALICLDAKGSMQWEYQIPTAKTEIYLTVLAYQSVLVAALNILYHISPDGKLLKSVINPFVITCRPIIDTTGKVYVAGKEGVRCLE